MKQATVIGLGQMGATLAQLLLDSGYRVTVCDAREVFATRARDEWVTHFAGRDACVAPVLGFGEAPARSDELSSSVSRLRVDACSRPLI